jgi:hypothetical protein
MKQVGFNLSQNAVYAIDGKTAEQSRILACSAGQGSPSKGTTMGPVSMTARNPVSQLTPDDFAAFPVWEYATDEEGQEGRCSSRILGRSASARLGHASSRCCV